MTIDDETRVLAERTVEIPIEQTSNVLKLRLIYRYICISVLLINLVAFKIFFNLIRKPQCNGSGACDHSKERQCPGRSVGDAAGGGDGACERIYT